jgi:hypothetical protein
MTTTDRLVRLEQLRAELASLLTRSERHTYGDPIENLGDLIADLQLEAEQVAASPATFSPD